MKDWETKQFKAQLVSDTTAYTLQGFIKDRTSDGVKVYTDKSSLYRWLPNRESDSQCVKDQARIEGIESFGLP